MRFLQGCRNIGDVADAKGNGVGIKAKAWKTQGFRILLAPDEAGQALFGRPLHAHFQHGGVDIGHRYIGARLFHPERDVPGAAGHVENVLAGARVYPADEIILPHPVHAGRHQIIHDVVTLCHRTENVAHAAGFLLRGNLFISKADGIAHRLSFSHRRLSRGLAAMQTPPMSRPCPSFPKSKP